MQLVVIAGPDKGNVYHLEGIDTLFVGRSKDTQTKLTDPHVSRVHCTIENDGDKFTLADKGSAAGTMVNGKKIAQPYTLLPGDVIRVGETQLRFQAGSDEQTTIGPATPLPGKLLPMGGAEKLADLAGKMLAHFEVGEVLARGRSSFIFKAKDTKENKEVALKVMKPEFSQDEEEMQRFIRAMKTMLPLRHDNLIALYGAGRTGPHCWVSMEYIDGEDLTEVIKRIGMAGMLDWRYALRVAIHIGRALAFAEQHSIIHRNITPTNIMVRSSDKVAKLGDLMLAKALEGTNAEQITRPGELLGEVHYMSPERTRGNANEVDARSDIYSLGATTYALLTGRPPFEGGSLVETITKIRQAEPVKPTKYQMAIPALLEGTVMRMLMKRPADRFQTAAEMLADLERVAKYQGLNV